MRSERAFTVAPDSQFADTLRIQATDADDIWLFVSNAHAPALLRDLAEATAKACGWETWTVRTRVCPRYNNETRVSIVLGGVEHVVRGDFARAIAVALLIAADEAERIEP